MTTNHEKLYLCGISRVDNYKGHYWVVRLNYVNGKPTINKLFSDNVFGTITQSFEFAIKYRNENISPEFQNKFSYKTSNKKDRLIKRLKVMFKHGRKKIYVGYGIEGAEKARNAGASKVTLWKIKTGKQNFYTVWQTMPGIDLNWKDRKTKHRADIDLQKINGKKKIIIGTGKEAAIKAQEMGASKGKCLNILHGKNDFYYSCYHLPFFEANGIKRTLDKNIIDKINKTVALYIKDNPLEVKAEVMLNYVSRGNDIDNEDKFIKRAVLKYGKIIRNQNNGNWRKDVSLDVNGDIERIDSYGEVMNGIGVQLPYVSE